MSEWQPIETAPKDGTPIDLWIIPPPEGDIFQPMAKAHRETDSWWCDGYTPFWAGVAPGWEATHWMPLPEPPHKGCLEWQPIETAPKDGTPILCLRADQIFIVRWWCAENGWSLDLEGDDYCAVLPSQRSPTHWMPLPEPPEGEE